MSQSLEQRREDLLAECNRKRLECYERCGRLQGQLAFAKDEIATLRDKLRLVECRLSEARDCIEAAIAVSDEWQANRIKASGAAQTHLEALRNWVDKHC
jgi:hypothetical protein